MSRFPDQNDLFEAIWKWYPNKQGRSQALAAYKEGIANGTDLEEFWKASKIQTAHSSQPRQKPNTSHMVPGSNQERWNDSARGA